MSDNNDRCRKLMELRDRLEHELNALKASLREEEEEGVGNPIEMVSVIKSLGQALSTVENELEKCSDTL